MQNTQRHQGRGGNVINQLFGASHPHPPAFCFVKYLPLVKTLIFIGLLTEVIMVSTPRLLLRKWIPKGEVICSKSPSRTWQNWRVLCACLALACGSAQRCQAMGRAFRSLRYPHVRAPRKALELQG